MTRRIESIAPDTVRIEVSPADFSLLRSALAETFENLEDWEFELRVGVPRARLLELLRFFLDEGKKLNLPSSS